MADDENITDELILLPGDPSAIAEPMVPIEEQVKGLDVGIPQDQHDLYDSYIDAINSGDNARRSTIKKFIDAEEQGLAGSEAWNRAAADHQLSEGIVQTDAAQEFAKDLGLGAIQWYGMEPLGMINRILPTIDAGVSTADKDYYGIKDFIETAFVSSGYEGDMVIPYDEYINNPRFREHMTQLQDYGKYKLAESISPELGEAARKADMTGDESELMRIFEDLSTEAMMNDDAELGMKLESLKNGTGWQVARLEGDNVIIDYLPKVDEGFFGLDMTLDPQFTKKGDLSLPVEGVWGMRDGKLVQLAPPISRPLDEFSMENTGISQAIAKNVAEPLSDMLAVQGPEMLPPEGAGPGYMAAMLPGLIRGVGWPAVKGVSKVGKAGYNLAKRQPRTNINRAEPFIAEGILSNIK